MLVNAVFVCSFVCVVVALKELSHGDGGFMQMRRQTLLHKVCTLSPGVDQTLHTKEVPF